MSQLLWSTLGIVCPTCDEHNAPRAMKCVSCGTALLDAGPTAKQAGASQRSSDRGTNPRIAALPPPAPAAPAPASAPSGMIPKVPAAAPPAVAKPPSVAPATMAPRSPAPAPGGTNPKISMPARPASGPAPAAKPPPPAPAAPPAAAAPKPAEPKPRTGSAEAVPPGLRPSARGTPADGLPSVEIDLETPFPPAVPVVAPAPAKPAAAASKFAMVVIAGGHVGQRFRLPATGCQVGRSRGAIQFPDDPFVSPLHASFAIRDGKLSVRDEGSTSGVMVSMHQEMLSPGMLFSAGNHLFRYGGTLEPVPPVQGRPVVYGAPLPQAIYLVEELLVGGRAGRAVVTNGPLLTIGQALCDLAFPGEEGLAPRHCELSPSPAGALLRDLSGGGLGTYIHLSGGERYLNPGDRVRIGEQILQVEILS